MNKKLRIARLIKGYNQKELAEKVGVTSKYISRLETTGVYPSPELMMKLAEELDFSVQELFFNN